MRLNLFDASPKGGNGNMDLFEGLQSKEVLEKNLAEMLQFCAEQQSTPLNFGAKDLVKLFKIKIELTREFNEAKAKEGKIEGDRREFLKMAITSTVAHSIMTAAVVGIPKAAIDVVVGNDPTADLSMAKAGAAFGALNGLVLTPALRGALGSVEMGKRLDAHWKLEEINSFSEHAEKVLQGKEGYKKGDLEKTCLKLILKTNN